jgi:2-phospho-L-lactate guanylyltransferase
MKTFAIVPVKDLDKAKSRLSAHLTSEQRKGLFLAMLDDVLNALSQLPIIVICPEDISAYLNERENVIFLMQKNGKDLNSAVAQANAYAIENGAQATLFIPADMPLVSRVDVEGVIELGRTFRAVITKARDGGTGILLRRPPDVMESRFSKNSFTDHQIEAREKGIEMHVHASFPLSLDIDTIEDLRLFMEHGVGTKTYEHLKHIGL